ncbi:MAG: MSCRAMM family protein [Pseudonocardiaceae bacterium]
MPAERNRAWGTDDARRKGGDYFGAAARAGAASRRPAKESGEAAAGPAVAVDHRPGPVIYGEVVHGGNPIAGAILTLMDLSGRQLDRQCSDTGGRYRLGPPGHDDYLLVICSSAVHPPGIALVAMADVPVRRDFVLPGAGANLSGAVHTAESDQPVADAMVTVLDGHGDVVGVTATGSDGRFGFRALAGGRYTLTVCATALNPVAHSIELPGHGDITHDVALGARVQLVGRVYAAGAPVPEALATVVDSDGHIVGSAITGTDGRFVFDDLQAGAYTIIATGYPSVTAAVHLGPGAPTDPGRRRDRQRCPRQERHPWSRSVRRPRTGLAVISR